MEVYLIYYKNSDSLVSTRLTLIDVYKKIILNYKYYYTLDDNLYDDGGEYYGGDRLEDGWVVYKIDIDSKYDLDIDSRHIGNEEYRVDLVKDYSDIKSAIRELSINDVLK